MSTNNSPSRLTRYFFYLTGGIGMGMVAPLYFFEKEISKILPPASTHPVYFYGFLGVTFAWQLAYALIGTDPQRYRWLMVIAALAKLSFATAVFALFLDQRISKNWLGAGAFDFVLALGFLWIFSRTPSLPLVADKERVAPLQDKETRRGGDMEN